MDESFEDIERKEGRGFRGRAVFLRAMEWVWKEFGRGSREAQIREGTGKLPVGITQAREQPLGKDCQMESSDRPSLGCAGSNHSAVVFDPATCPWTPTGVCRWLCLTLLLGFFFFLPFLHHAAGTPSLYGLPWQTSTSALRFIPTVPNAFYIGILEMRGKAVWPDGNCTWPSWFLQSGPHSVCCSVYLPWPSFLSDVWHTTMNVLVVHDASVSLSILWPWQSKSYCSCIWCRRFWRW